ncbi:MULTISPECIES: CaiB/BaiF CoA-transferase family protein [unclassified Mesorhizobium]|uniref:CaiB/BaiF CoA transferase family protein n=1 Tax=unclassified Mesorhizobium TaxID=325217 RepID=UPI002417613B|nr:MULTISPECIES: CaiB/BaiF CoA-transferase family protein [unclassified Mesorhizobium]WFP65567.1 CaiB/BaiF CoA-transferase family protein [Mesorhizobium sp. WSM4904]WFP78832.1 CaiB/BaiF CoA-transferase family protein [Mesorhizobium sp. WSM4906]
MRPLQGLRVLDFSTLLPGPLASLLLAEAGADVVKIERPGTGEDMRGYEPRWGRDSVNFAMLNRGKKSLALDLKRDRDRAVLAPLLESADIVLEQFRPGVMQRLGLDYATVAKTNPRVIYCSITGYGQSGPKRDVAGHDLNYIGDTGLLSLSMGTPQMPVLPPALVADIAGGAYPAVINILLALEERRATGKGRHLDIAMTDNLFTFMYWAMGSGLVTQKWPGNGTDLVTGGTPRYRLYPTQDGRFVAAAPIEQKFWDHFCDLIDLQQRYRDDTIDPSETVRQVTTIISSRPSQHWRESFAGRDCCCSIVATLKEALADPHFAARGVFSHLVTNEAGQTLKALPVPINAGFRGDAGEPLAAPILGGFGAEPNGSGR